MIFINNVRINLSIKARSFRWLSVFSLACLVGLLQGCGRGTAVQQDLCEPFDGLIPICGFQSPEDLAVLPDGSGILVSEFGQMGEIEGRLSILDITTYPPASSSIYQRRELYSSASSNDLRTRPVIWGEMSCDEPTFFSPHGFDLSQRPSGRWQLLVVNHGERETVEMFELLKDKAQQWQLLWRGCVEAPDDSSFNDVAALNDGFVVTRMMSRTNNRLGVIDYFLNRDTGFLWRWRLSDGFQVMPGTEGVLPNGVVAQLNGPLVYLNLYGEDKLRVVNRVTQTMVDELAIHSADNTNWDVSHPGKLLVTSHQFKIFDMISCMGDAKGNCQAEFDVIELDTDDFSQKVLLHTDGEYYGAGTATVRLGDTLYIGSFSGERILVAPVGYGTN